MRSGIIVREDTNHGFDYFIYSFHSHVAPAPKINYPNNLPQSGFRQAPCPSKFYLCSMNPLIRPIQPSDNPALARIVRDTLKEFGANHPGTVYYDHTTDSLFELFQQGRSWYFVVETNGTITGGAGIYPTPGLPDDTCELVKMYLLPETRGLGLGRTLIENCMEKAASFGYQKIYIETMPELKQALNLYAKFGFEYLSGPMGNSGHTGCSLWMLKKL